MSMTLSNLQFSASDASGCLERQNRLEEGGDAVLFQGKRAVIVEDEGIIQMQLRKSLVRMGLQVVGSAVSGDEGVEICLRERPEIIFMDINMPGKINGLEAARRILSHYRVCILMITAYTEYEEEAKKIGACGYLVKPVDAKMLHYYLRQAYARFEAAGSY